MTGHSVRRHPSLAHAFQATAAVAPDAVALRTVGDAVSITWAQYAQRVERIAGGLAALGVGRGDTVALMMANRPEFHLVDTAALHLGATPFSVYNTLPAEEVAHLFANAGNRVAVVDAVHAAVVRAAGPDVQIAVVEGPSKEAQLTLAELEATRAPADHDFAATWGAVGPDDVLTLIYTSGTTGPPKGVELTHANMLAQCESVSRILHVEHGDVVTSYLPSAHIADRWSAHYTSIVHGVQVVDVPDPRTIAQALPVVRPTIWGGVPRVLEKLQAALVAGIAADPDDQRRRATERAIELGVERVRAEQRGEELPPDLAAEHERLEALVLAPLRARLGLERCRWICVGAAPLSRGVHEFVLGLGLPVVELYGMSEASCVVTTIAPEEVRVGTVGRPISCVEVRVAGDGELLVRGSTITRGYRGQPEKTAEAIDADGWLHTGDVVHRDERGHLTIVDRKKELIINAAGKNMSPANIEQKIKDASPLIGQACVIGDGRPYNVALVTLDPDAAAGLDAGDPEVRERIERAVAEANERLARVEQIKSFELLPEEWLPGGEELTPTMKLKRKPIGEKYADRIEALYLASPAR